MSALRSYRIEDDAAYLVLENAIEAIEAGQRALRPFLETLDLSPETLNGVEVVFEEIVSNAVRHGFRPGSGQTVYVKVTPAAGGVELSFEDDGEPFNPLEAEAPLKPGSLAEAKPGGLGIPLVKRLAADIRYARPSPSSGAFRPVNQLVLTLRA